MGPVRQNPIQMINNSSSLAVVVRPIYLEMPADIVYPIEV